MPDHPGGERGTGHHGQPPAVHGAVELHFATPVHNRDLGEAHGSGAVGEGKREGQDASQQVQDRSGRDPAEAVVAEKFRRGRLDAGGNGGPFEDPGDVRPGRQENF